MLLKPIRRVLLGLPAAARQRFAVRRRQVLSYGKGGDACEDLRGYVVTEMALDKLNFQVGVACAEDYVGKPKATECSKALTPFTVSGCQKKIYCQSPDDTTGYQVVEKSKVAQLFDVKATCARGYEGTAVVRACSKTGEKYTLSGCKYSTTTCLAPAVTTGYTVTEVELRKIVFDVSVKCGPGYEGAPKVAACTKDKEAYRLSGCAPMRVCHSPSDLTGYRLTESSLDMDSFKVSVGCADDYVGNPKAVQCKKPLTSFTLSGCQKKIHCQSPGDTTGYQVAEKAKVAQLFDVTATCARGYEGTAVVKACSKTDETYSLTGCKYSTTTCLAPAVTTGYTVTEVELREDCLRCQCEMWSGL